MFWASCGMSYECWVMVLKLSLNRFVLMRMLLGFSCNNCVGVACIVTPHLHYWTRVQAARSARRSSFTVFSINLVTWRLFSPAEKATAYMICGWSVLPDEYESVATARFRRWVPVMSNFEKSSAWKLVGANVAVLGGSLNACFQRVLFSTKTFVSIV